MTVLEHAARGGPHAGGPGQGAQGVDWLLTSSRPAATRTSELLGLDWMAGTVIDESQAI